MPSWQYITVSLIAREFFVAVTALIPVRCNGKTLIRLPPLPSATSKAIPVSVHGTCSSTLLVAWATDPVAFSQYMFIVLCMKG